MSNKANIHIAISGQSGCGNTTVSRELATKLGLAFVNYTFRSIAEEDGISFAEVSHRAELSDDDDMRVDSTQMRMARRTPSVIGSRLAIWLLKEADLKVFLTASLTVRGGRIQKREGGNLEEVISTTFERDKRDCARYKRIYGIDTSDYSEANFIVNTDRLTANEVVELIVKAAQTVIRYKTALQSSE